MPPGRPLFPLLSDLETLVASSGPNHPASPLPSSNNSDEVDTAPLPPPPAASPARPWFLGLDIGTLGISALLLNRVTGQQVPVFWQQAPSEPRWFRWPIENVIGPQAAIATPLSATEAAILCQLKPALALPLRRGLAGSRERLPLQDPVYRPLAQMLATLVSPSDAEQPAWHCGALGLNAADFAAAMQALAGIAVSYPAGWPNQYQTNVQNAILAAKLVAQPSDIHFVQEAIAAALAYLPRPATEASLPHGPTLSSEGLAFVISAGTSTSELALVDLTALGQGDCGGLASRTVAYGGRALDQDILLHVLYPQLQGSAQAEVGQLLAALQLNSLELPRLGQPDSGQRLRLHLRLCSSELGRHLLAIAQQLKFDLQTQGRCTYTLAQHSGQVTRDELGHRILLPYIHLLTQQAQALVAQVGISPTAVRHSVCAGSTAAMPVVHLWVKQRFPAAPLLSLPTQATLSPNDETAPGLTWLGSPISYGLAHLASVLPSLAHGSPVGPEGSAPDRGSAEPVDPKS